MDGAASPLRDGPGRQEAQLGAWGVMVLSAGAWSWMSCMGGLGDCKAGLRSSRWDNIVLWGSQGAAVGLLLHAIRVKIVIPSLWSWWPKGQGLVLAVSSARVARRRRRRQVSCDAVSSPARPPCPTAASLALRSPGVVLQHRCRPAQCGRGAGRPAAASMESGDSDPPNSESDSPPGVALWLPDD